MGVPRQLRRHGLGRWRPLVVAAIGAAVLACGAATAAAQAPTLYVANEGDDTVSAIDTETGTVTPITVGSLPQAVAIDPDGTFAYVTDQGSGSVSVIDTATDQVVGSPIEVGEAADSMPEGIAINPEGTALYVTYGYRPETPIGPGEVAVFSTSVPHELIARIRVGDEPAGIAITPDGEKAFVADYGSGQITEIKGLKTAKPEAVDPPIEVGGTPTAVAISADGASVYVSNGNSAQVSVLSAATGALVRTLTGFQAPQGIATSPAGDGAYVADFDGSRLTALDAGDQVLGTVGVAADPFGVVYDPDGKTVYASSSNPGGAGTVSTIDVATRVVRGTVEVDDVPLGMAISPDQAPEARLSVTARSAGGETEFDAGESTVRYGKIADYVWNFGDGSSKTTSAPKTGHTYAKAGIYRVTLTEIDSAGTSTTRVFTGQTVSRNGGPSATLSRSVAVPEARPRATPSPTALDFGDQTISQLYLSKPVTLTDTGDAPLQVESVALTGAGARSFAIDDDHCSGRTLAPGEGCIVEVLFLPITTGAKAAALGFSDDAAGSPQTVTLAGVGQTPVIAVSPPRLEFPDQAPGTDSQPLTLTVTNSGEAPLQVEGIATAGKDAGEFAVVGQTCAGAPVEPGHACSIEVRFEPTSFGPRNALVQIEDDAPGSPHVAAVVGSGVGSEASIAPAQLSFAVQQAGTRGPSQAVTVTDTGNAPLQVLGPLLQGAGATAFALGDDECTGRAISPGASCTLAVAFAPAAAGAYAAQLTLDDDAAGASPAVALSGTATAAGGAPGPGPVTGSPAHPPAAPPSPASPATPPKPPVARIVGARINSARGRATFRFKALGAPATGFRCALRRRAKRARFHPCRSPRVYRHLKPGRYAFKVQALGVGGATRPAVRRFRIRR